MIAIDANTINASNDATTALLGDLRWMIEEANKPYSAIRLQAVVLDSDQLGQKTATVVSQSQLATRLGLHPSQVTSSTTVAGEDETPLFKPAEQKVAQIAWEVIRKLESQPQAVPTVGHLKKPEIQAAIVKAVEEQHRPVQLALEGVAERPDIAAVVPTVWWLTSRQSHRQSPLSSPMHSR